MAFFAGLSDDPGLRSAVRSALSDRYVTAACGTMPRLLRLVRERPVTGVVVDEAAVSGRPGGIPGAVSEIRMHFPSVSLVFLAGPRTDPHTLLRLGREGIDSLVLLSPEGLLQSLPGACAQAYRRSVPSLVARRVSPYLPMWEARVLRMALDGVVRGWSAEDLAGRLCLSRPHLSERLKDAGLPSAGRLLVWGRLLHAGRWLEDPGRTAESVSRQLDYSSGAAFRRALRNYLGTTPTETRARGGLDFVLDRFLADCSLDRDRRTTDRSAA